MTYVFLKFYVDPFDMRDTIFSFENYLTLKMHWYRNSGRIIFKAMIVQ